jgi:hypothetical protein
MLLYLDVDGVLHCDSVYRAPGRGIYITRGRLFEQAPALETALKPFPQLSIVLSTSWVEAVGYSGTLKRLPVALRLRVVGATYHRKHTPTWRMQTRFNQIVADVARRRIGDRWLAIDDDAFGWPDSMRQHLILTKGSIGLQPEDLALLVQRLTTRLGCGEADKPEASRS